MQRRPALHAVLVAAAVLAGVPAQAQPGPLPPAGVWMRDGGKAAVELFACGDALCGRLVWGRPDLWPPGRVHLDSRNPDPALRGRALCGLQVIGALRPAGPGRWSGGWVYDPETGSTYDAELSVAGPDALRVRGYRFISLLGRSQVWHPAPPALGRCDDGG